MNDPIDALKKFFRAAMNGRVDDLGASVFDELIAALNLDDEGENVLDELMKMADTLQADFSDIRAEEYQDGVDATNEGYDNDMSRLYSELEYKKDIFNPYTRNALRRTADHLTDRDPFKSYEDTEEYGRLLMRLSDSND